MIVSVFLGFFSLFTDIVYWIKWLTSYTLLKWQRFRSGRRFDLYDYDVQNNPEMLGIISPKEERILESPFPECHLVDADDEIFFYGVNSDSESLLVRIARTSNHSAQAWIYLKLKQGRILELKDISGYQHTFGDKATAFSCGGLQAQYLSAMRRWRIHYSGMLRQRTENSASANHSVFVKFTFLWNASSDVYDVTSDTKIHSTASSIAQAKWKDLSPPVTKLREVLDVYAQSGVMVGTVTVRDEPDHELYLFGEKIRFLGKGSRSKGFKFKYILGSIPKNGLIIHLAKASLPNAFENLPFGFIVHPSGEIKVVEDAVIISKFSEKDVSSRNLKAAFKAEKDYELIGTLKPEEKLTFEAEETSEWYLEVLPIDFEVKEFKGSGFWIQGEIFGSTQRKISSFLPVLPETVPVTVFFTDEMAQLPEVSGGKGSSLGRLTQSNRSLISFTVPKGIIVTTAAYKTFITPEIFEKIETLKNVVYGNMQGDVQETCKMVCSAIESSYLPDKISKEIEHKLNTLFEGRINNHSFAVRSSSTGEDTDQMSAAGQMETFLGIKGLKEVLTAVKKCWGSQFKFIPVEYKRQNGQILNTPMAVVIQEMADCETAGVMFTCDPVTSDPSVITITGNYGLGESVVSGNEEPDTIILEKTKGDELNIRSITVGSKKNKIVINESNDYGGITVTKVSEHERHRCCIPKHLVLKLGRVALEIEEMYKSLRDIEWGARNDEIFILQSRPVTTGAATTDFEIKHEFDCSLPCENEHYTKCNVGEVMPGAMSPLGFDVFYKNVAVVLRKKMRLRAMAAEHREGKYHATSIVSFYYQMFLSVVKFTASMGDVDSFICKAFMLALFGRILDDPSMLEVLKYKELKPKKSIVDLLYKLLKLFFTAVGMEKLREETFSYRFPEDKKSAVDVFQALMANCSFPSKTFEMHVLCSECSIMWNMLLFVMLTEAKGSLDNDVYNDFAKLLASSKDVESADVPFSIQELAECITNDMKSETFKAMSVEDAQQWLETSSSESSRKYHQFIERHGHRCLKEYDMHSTTWEKDPSSLIKLLQNLSGYCKNAKENIENDFAKLISSLTTPLDLKTRWILKLVLSNCRRGVRERESAKSNLIKSIDNYRKGFQLLSKAMVAEGFLPDTDLIYFMTTEEIEDLLNTRNPRIISRAKHRRRLFPELENLRFDEMSKGRPEPVNERSQDDDLEHESDLKMKGIPVSHGVTKGYARVALSIDEASQLKPGEILITYSTDIGWSPYFPILSGVVTEIGGLISHGAVVSREYGLPCVVGLRNATRMFHSGDYVLLDGNRGFLQRISQPET